MQQLSGAFTEPSRNLHGAFTPHCGQFRTGTSSAGVCFWPIGPPLAHAAALGRKRPLSAITAAGTRPSAPKPRRRSAQFSQFSFDFRHFLPFPYHLPFSSLKQQNQGYETVSTCLLLSSSYGGITRLVLAPRGCMDGGIREVI